MEAGRIGQYVAELVRVSVGVGGIDQGCLWEWEGLVRVSTGVRFTAPRLYSMVPQ